jgi:hypothetical protein
VFSAPTPFRGGVVMDTMTILMATTMETMVTGIVVVMDQGTDPVMGDEITGIGL